MHCYACKVLISASGGSFSTVRGNLIKTAQEFSHFTVGLGFGFANYLSHKHKVQQDHNITYSWSYFWPSSDKLETVAKLAEESKIKPVVDKVFNAADYLQAFEYLESGSHFGKVVLSFENLPRDE
jgi:NADPH:quinone reductase-like Zn-dependent oxidoreductase